MADTTDDNSTNVNDPTNVKVLTLSQIDDNYEQIGCLGRGGFGSVFLAQRKSESERYVAIKTIAMTEHKKESFQREVTAMLTLQRTDKEEQRDKAISYLRDWFKTPDNVAFLVMNFYEGGTLAGHITQSSQPFTERRIAWYMLQLCEALAYAHSHDVSHHDVKSENVVIDSRDGGRLVLTDFGASRKQGQDVIGCTVNYLAPEALAAYRKKQDLGSFDSQSLDSFALGCIALELLQGSEIPGAASDYIEAGHLPSAFPSLSRSSHYSSILREGITLRLLDPNPTTRQRPSALAKALREDPESPLLAHQVKAAHELKARDLITMDNIQLGCFVQRGPDWDSEDGNLDGGEGCVGVVVSLDPDALFCKVCWPSMKTQTHRIGSKCLMELAVSQPLPNGISSGFLTSSNPSKYEKGSIFQGGNQSMAGMIVVGAVEKGIFLTPPTSFQVQNQYRKIRSMQLPPERPVVMKPAPPLDPEPYPSNWELNRGRLMEVKDKTVWDSTLSLIFNKCGGLSRDRFTVLSIKRVQCVRYWEAYARRRETVAIENWGQANEKRLFHGTSKIAPSTFLNDAVGFGPRFLNKGCFSHGAHFSENAAYSNEHAYKVEDANNSTSFQMFLSRVALGRMDTTDVSPLPKTREPKKGCHSVKSSCTLRNKVKSNVFVINEASTQAFPEYLITYKYKQARRIVKATRPPATPEQ